MKRFLCIAAVLCLIAGAASAQTGGVTGLIVDPDGNAVEGAKVSLWLDEACQGYAMTDAAGIFNFTDVPIGTYLLKAGKPKVGSAILENVEVLDGQVTDIGTLTLLGSGPHGPNGGKYQYQHQYQQGQDD